MSKKVYSTTTFIIFSLFLLVTDRLLAAPLDHAAVLAPFVNDDTMAVGYVDVAALNARNIGELASLLPKLPETAQAEMFGIMMFSGFTKNFQDAGGQEVFALVALGDIHMNGGPLVIATTRPGRQPEEVQKMFRDMIRQVASPFAQEIEIQQKGDVVLVGTNATVARYVKLKSAARNDLISPLAKLTGDGAVAAAVFCPGADYRRVSRELWPQLPGQLAPLRGELADRWLHFEAAVNLPPNPKPRIALQAKDADAAAIFVKLYRSLPAAPDSIKELGSPPPELKQVLQTVVHAIPPQQDGARVTLNLPADEKQLVKLQQLLALAGGRAIESSQQKQRMIQFKQLMLAMLNYHDVHKRLPPAAVRDKDGRPLLSWRVAILPFLEEGELYKQFHLDEPWDSPHNRGLIAKMPTVFADPDPKLRQLVGEGKTAYQVPVGPEMIFCKKEGTTIHEITDGTSKTIAIVEVEPLQAVVWTKPDDWQVDLQHPRQGVERADRKNFVAAWCDGSVQAVPVTIDETALRAHLTRAGGENVDRP